MNENINSLHCEFRITGLSCIDCASRIEEAISSLKWVKEAKVNFSTSLLKVAASKADIDKIHIEKDIRHELTKIGFGIDQAEDKSVLFKTDRLIDNSDKKKIKHAVTLLKGVVSLKIIKSREIKIEYDSKLIDVYKIRKTVNDCGINISLDNCRKEESLLRENRGHFILAVISSIFICAGIWFSVFYSEFDVSGANLVNLFYMAAMISGGYYSGRRGFLAVRYFRPDINFLMCVAVIGAACIGEWLEGATVIFLFLLAQLLETYTLDKARNAIRSLMKISPKDALVKDGYGEKYILVEDVKIGDVIIVKPGERIPLDGNVLNGRSTVNQSPITGESIPVEKAAGDEVYAGTINENGSLDIEVMQLSKDSTIAKIIHLIEDAQSQKAPFQSFVDKFAKYYTPVVILIAIFAAVIPPLVFHAPFSLWFYRSLVLLVISCPCALVISTPVSLISGIAGAAKKGVLFKGGVYLEQIGGIRAIAFDKTGTLTNGKPEVTDIIPVEIENENELIRLAASIEARSEHSIANAILTKAVEKGLKLYEGVNFQSVPGKGAVMEIDNSRIYIGNVSFFKENGFLVGKVANLLENLRNNGKTTVILGRDKTILGIIAVSDQVRNMCGQTINDLYNMGIKKIVMLTGDHKGTAETICKQVNINEFVSELSPEGKVEEIKKLRKTHGAVAMVGDGINDAPALTAASIGVAMGGSCADITLESADVTIMGDDLSGLPFAIKIGRSVTSVIKQNICISIIIKLVFLLMIAPGFTTLWMAVGADMGASLIVIINGLRLISIGKNSN